MSSASYPARATVSLCVVAAEVGNAVGTGFPAPVDATTWSGISMYVVSTFPNVITSVYILSCTRVSCFMVGFCQCSFTFIRQLNAILYIMFLLV